MKKRAKPGGAATFLAHPRRHSLAPCQPPRSLLSPRRRSRPPSPPTPPLPPPPIRAADRRRRTADPYRIERIATNGSPGSGGSDPAPFLFFPTSRPSSIAPPALDRPCAPPALSLSAPFFSSPRSICSSARAEANRPQMLRQITQGERARGRALCLAGLRRTQKRATKKGRREGIGAGRGAERGGEPKGK